MKNCVWSFFFSRDGRRLIDLRSWSLCRYFKLSLNRFGKEFEGREDHFFAKFFGLSARKTNKFISSTLHKNNLHGSRWSWWYVWLFTTGNSTKQIPTQDAYAGMMIIIKIWKCLIECDGSIWENEPRWWFLVFLEQNLSVTDWLRHYWTNKA